MVAASLPLVSAPESEGPGGALRGPTLVRVENRQHYPLGLAVQILEDRSGRMNYEQVRSPTQASAWRQSQSVAPNFVFSRSAYWMRLYIRNEQPQAQALLLEVASPVTDYIDAYFAPVGAGTPAEVIKTGDRLPWNTRSVPHRNFLFRLDLAPGESRSVYLRFASHDGLHDPLPLTLWKRDAFSEHDFHRTPPLGSLMLVVFVMGLYNLFLGLALRSVSYLYFAIFLVGLLGTLGGCGKTTVL